MMGRVVLDEAAATELLQSICSSLHDIASAAYGPNGHTRVLQVQDGAGAGVVTSCSSRLAQGMRFTDRFSALLMQATVTSQNSSFGDGGLLSLLLASRLILDALASSRGHASRLETIAAYTAAAHHISELTSSSGFSLSIKSSGISAYTAVASAALGSKIFSGVTSRSSLKKLSMLLVESFLSTFDPANAHSEPPVKPLALAGLPYELSFNLPSLLMNVQVPPNSAKLLKSLTVDEVNQKARDPSHQSPPMVIALFDISLEPSSINQSGPQSHESEGAIRSSILDIGAAFQASSAPQDPELESLYDLVRSLHKMGVKVLASQKLICEQVQQMALELGILPIHRLSIIHIHSVSRLTGAIPISSALKAEPSWSGLFGLVGDISIVRVGQKNLLHFEPSRSPSSIHPRARPVHTLVLGANCELQAEELRASTHSALKALSWAMREPFVLPGGGCAESMISGHLRRVASKMEPRVKRVFDNVAMAIESAAALVVGRRLGGSEMAAVIQSLEGHSRKQRDELCGRIEHIGWDAFEGQFLPVATSSSSTSDVLTADLLDVSVIKTGSILTAIEAACMMLRINGALLNQASS